MGNLRLGDWSIEVPGYSPEIGDTFSRDILGTTYQTVIMPDGKEWIAANFAWDGAGAWFGWAESDNGWGRFYHRTHIAAVKSALEGSGWRVPSDDLYAGEFHSLQDAIHYLCRQWRRLLHLHDPGLIPWTPTTP